MNATLPQATLGILGALQTAHETAAPVDDAHEGSAFDDTLKSLADEDERDEDDARHAAAATAYAQPPAHVLATFVNQPPRAAQLAAQATVVDGADADAVAGATGADASSTGAAHAPSANNASLGKAEFAADLWSAADAAGYTGIGTPGFGAAARPGEFDPSGAGTEGLPAAAGFGEASARSASLEASSTASAALDPRLVGDAAALAAMLGSPSPAGPTAPAATSPAATGPNVAPAPAHVGGVQRLAEGHGAGGARDVEGKAAAAEPDPRIQSVAGDTASFTSSAVQAPAAASAASTATTHAKADAAPPATAPIAAAPPARPTSSSSSKSDKSASPRVGSLKAEKKAPFPSASASPGTATDAAPTPTLGAATDPTAKPETPVKTVTPEVDPKPAQPSESAKEAVRLAEQVGHRRVLSSGEAHGEISVPELGRVEVRAHSDASKPDGAVQVHVQVDDAGGRAVVQQHAPELRAHVRAEVPNAHVHLGQNSGNSGSSERRSGGERRGGEGDSHTGADVAGDEATPKRQIRGQARYVL